MQGKMIKLFKLTNSTTIYEIESETDFMELLKLYSDNKPSDPNIIDSDSFYPIYPGNTNSQIKIRNIKDNYDNILLISYLNPLIHYQEFYDCNDHEISVIKNMKKKWN